MSVEWRERSLYEKGHAKWAPDTSLSARRQPKELEQRPILERVDNPQQNNATGSTTPQRQNVRRPQQPNLYLKRSQQQQKQEDQRISQAAAAHSSQTAVVAIRASKSPERMLALVTERPPPLPVNRGSSARPDISTKSQRRVGDDGYETRPELVAAALKRRMQALKQEKDHMEYYLLQARLLDSLFLLPNE
ncbi:Hypothetical protein, putative [Bodo saltans]|uniref:Uncharacterized protein n=1 Tax=Bodo saltans TaxID=75058 RepID=A0A0S4JMB4_BODSA|nr:Hypothetical protein, putative [Bodo saltans]|eukprot:CUG90242.1 Hypothetical protein, putative [Bodo saltans]